MQNPGLSVHPYSRSTLSRTHFGKMDHHHSSASSHALRYVPGLQPPVYVRPKRRRPFRLRPYCRFCKQIGHAIAYCYCRRDTRHIFPSTQVCHHSCCIPTQSSTRSNATVTSTHATPIVQATPRIMQAPPSSSSFHSVLMLLAAISLSLTRSAAKVVPLLTSLTFSLFATLHAIHKALHVPSASPSHRQSHSQSPSHHSINSLGLATLHIPSCPSRYVQYTVLDRPTFRPTETPLQPLSPRSDHKVS